MKALKWLAAAALIALVAAVAGVWFLMSGLDELVRTAIEKFGSQVTQTQVTAQRVSLSLREGKGSIGGVIIANPAGFAEPSLFTLGDITVALDTAGTGKDKVVIEEVHIAAPGFTYEVNDNGAANVDVLKKNVESFTGPAKPKTGESDPGGAVKVVIRRLVVEQGKITVRLGGQGEPVTVALPRFEMRNIGGGGGAAPGEVAQQIARQMSARVSRAVVEGQVGAQITRFKGAVGGQAGAGAAQIAGGVTKLFGK